MKSKIFEVTTIALSIAVCLWVRGAHHLLTPSTNYGPEDGHRPTAY
ncbi:hypothetical protein [Prevotella sp. P5-108]|nr:hypothetical protein [Prevotella sp. P5-108]